MTWTVSIATKWSKPQVAATFSSRVVVAHLIVDTYPPNQPTNQPHIMVKWPGSDLNSFAYFGCYASEITRARLRRARALSLIKRIPKNSSNNQNRVTHKCSCYYLRHIQHCTIFKGYPKKREISHSFKVTLLLVTYFRLNYHNMVTLIINTEPFCN